MARDPISSLTGNTDLYPPTRSLFFGVQDLDGLISEIHTELLEIVVKQSVVLFMIDEDSTPAHDLYNESMPGQKSFRPPVRLYARVEYTQPVQASTQFGIETKYSINVYFPKFRLLELGVVPKAGDFVEYDSKYFELTTVREYDLIYGLPEFKIGYLCAGIATREEVFSPHKAGTYNEGDIKPDSHM